MRMTKPAAARITNTSRPPVTAMATIRPVFSPLLSTKPALHITIPPSMSVSVTCRDVVQQSAPQYSWCSSLLPRMKLSRCQKFPSEEIATDLMPECGAVKMMLVCQEVTYG